MARFALVAGLALVAVLGACAARPAAAYGPEGHLIAGRAAEPRLCPRAATEIARLGGGEDLGELGLWADRIRSNPDYADAAPWHYMNIDNGASLPDYEHPPEGDVLEAIERFSGRLADPGLDDEARAKALKFLVHFVVDLHQPLHVGLAEDRGGNTIALSVHGETTNLHRFWDTGAIDAAGEVIADYTRSVGRLADRRVQDASLDPLVWAGEALDLRADVYAFGREGQEPPTAYLDFAAAVTRARLALAALRLAGTLNALLCPSLGP